MRLDARRHLGSSEVKRHFQTTDFTVCVHDEPLAGQEVPHVHVHVLPRTVDDGGGTLMSMWHRVGGARPRTTRRAGLASSGCEVMATIVTEEEEMTHNGEALPILSASAKHANRQTAGSTTQPTPPPSQVRIFE